MFIVVCSLFPLPNKSSSLVESWKLLTNKYKEGHGLIESYIFSNQNIPTQYTGISIWENQQSWKLSVGLQKKNDINELTKSIQSHCYCIEILHYGSQD